jgi:hypothetical protein
MNMRKLNRSQDESYNSSKTNTETRAQVNHYEFTHSQKEAIRDRQNRCCFGCGKREIDLLNEAIAKYCELCIKMDVLSEDDASEACGSCTIQSPLTIHHEIPVWYAIQHHLDSQYITHLDNGIALCQPCHTERENNPRYINEQYFQQKLRAIRAVVNRRNRFVTR